MHERNHSRTFIMIKIHYKLNAYLTILEIFYKLVYKYELAVLIGGGGGLAVM